MKNLAKTLNWEGGGRVNQFAYVYDYSAMYILYEYSKGFSAALSIDDNLVWQRTGFNCIDEAKAACQQHYAESLWDNLSVIARDILKKHLNLQTPNT